MLLQIAEALPREMQGILACCNPVPPLLRANLLELHQIILRAREQSLEKVSFIYVFYLSKMIYFYLQPILKEENRSRGSTKQIFKINVDSPLHCPHDLSKDTEFCDNLPTLLNKKQTTLNFAHSLNLEQTSCTISILGSSGNSDDEMDDAASAKLKELKFLGPYDRYKLVKPFVEAEEAKTAAKTESVVVKEELMVEEEADRSIEDRIAEVSKQKFVKFFTKAG